MYREIRQRKNAARQAAATPPPQRPGAAAAERIIRPSLAPRIVGSLPLVALWLVTIFGIVADHDIPEAVEVWVWLLVLWSLLFGINMLIAIKGAKYIIQRDSIVAHVGIISRRIVKVRIADIRSLSMSQGIIGRMLHFGSVYIYTAATSKAEIIMRAVPRPEEIVATLDEMRP